MERCYGQRGTNYGTLDQPSSGCSQWRSHRSNAMYQKHHGDQVYEVIMPVNPVSRDRIADPCAESMLIGVL